jgi:hypothetical protein
MVVLSETTALCHGRTYQFFIVALVALVRNLHQYLPRPILVSAPPSTQDQ